MDKIYLDNAATTPTDPQVFEAMRPYFIEEFGNASSPHAMGRTANKALEESREVLASFIGAKTEEIVFNSGATEGNNHAILGVARSCEDKGKHIIISPIEHHSVFEPIEYLRTQGYTITYLPVDEFGKVDPKDVEQAITEETVLIAVMHASNEVGTIQPVKEIGQIAKSAKIPFLVDACQSVGHIPVNVQEIGCDFLSLSAHKFYGPKGVGALYIRKKTNVFSLLMGGDQERSRRASTQNIPGIVGLAKAIDFCKRQMKQEAEEQIKLRDRLFEEVPKFVEGCKINGHLTDRLPNNAHFSFENVVGESLLMSLDMAGLCCSMGSACTSGAMEPSRVLRAMGLSDELAFGSLRITSGRFTKEKDIDQLLEQLPKLISVLNV